MECGMPTAKTVKLGRKGQLVLPKEIRDSLGLAEGDRLLVSLEGERVILASVEKYAAETKGILRGTWGRTEEEVEGYLQRERSAWEGGKS
jgi:AbrB family looped-hinge helix DNA binding protein